MKFYKVITQHTQCELDKLLKRMSSTEVEYIQSLYSRISIVEYTDENNFECMFAIIDNYFLKKLEILYNSYNLKFNLIDLTRQIINDDFIKTKYYNNYQRNVEEEIIDLIKKYKKECISKDDILDKILDKGIDSLTDFDLDILNS